MNSILGNVIQDMVRKEALLDSPEQVATDVHSRATDQDKEAKREMNKFYIKGVADLVRSQIHFVSADIAKMQSLRRFDDEYKADRQHLKDIKKEFVSLLNILTWYIKENVKPPFLPEARVREIMDKNVLDIKEKYFKKPGPAEAAI